MIKHPYSDVIMGAMVSQITDVSIVHLTVSSSAYQGKQQRSVSLVFVSGELPAHRASNAENVSTWWRHHAQLQPNAMDGPHTGNV